MGILETIYNNSPICIQNLMCSARGWQIRRRRYAKGFFRELTALKHREIAPDAELKHFLLLAKEVPAYAAVFANNPMPRLEDFPIIDKAYVKAHYADFVNPLYKGPTIHVHTSGTTGTSLDVLQSQVFEHRQWATWWRFREELGIKFDTWYGWFGCGEMIVPIQQDCPPYWRVDFAGRRVMFGTYHLNINNVDLYIREIKRRRLAWLHGNASRLCYLSRLVVEKGIQSPDCVKFVTTASENLPPSSAREIEKAFPGAIVRTHYGQTEGVANFSQTLAGDWRVDNDFAHVEFIPVDPSDTKRCRIVGTNFSNVAFPLIRYAMGDIALVDWNGDRPKVLGIEGRENERITLGNGMLISSLFNYDIFGDSQNVREAQVRVLDDFNIELLVVKGSGYNNDDERQILHLARRYLKDEISVSIRYTTLIPRSVNGKFRAVIRIDDTANSRHTESNEG